MGCDTCVFYPPSACDGKPCCVCDTDNALFNCYQPASEDGGVLTETRTGGAKIMLCDTCINARAILSENGWHRVCSLSSKSASRCIIGEKSQYIKNFAMCDGYLHEER